MRTDAGRTRFTMALLDLPALADRLPEFDTALAALQTGKGAIEIEGLAGPAKGFALARLFARLNKTILVITYQQEQAQRLWDDLVRFGVKQEQVCVMPASQSLFLEGDVTDYRVIGERIGGLTALAGKEPAIVIGTIEAVLQRTSPRKALVDPAFSVEAGAEVDMADVVKRLVQMGYDAANAVTRPGEFSRRGGILDVFPSTADGPVRIELFGDEIESIRPFDVVTQRSSGRRAVVDFAPAREIRLESDMMKLALVEIKNAYQARKAQLVKDNSADAREAIERLTDRYETNISHAATTGLFRWHGTVFSVSCPRRRMRGGLSARRCRRYIG